jgi:hypothetical protein
LKRAYVATLYLLGERAEALSAWEADHDTRALARMLASPDKETRVAALAGEVARIALALERGDIE